MEDFAGNVVKLDLTRSLRGKNLELKTKIKLSDDKETLTGELLSLQLMPHYIKKVMRRGTDYVEDSFEITCKDSRLRIKPFMITRKRVSRAVRNSIRTAAKKHIENHGTIRTTQELFSEIMTNKFQKELSLKIKKIYPLGLCEIRIIKVLERFDNKKKVKNKEPEKKTEFKDQKTEKTKGTETEDKK